MTQLEHHRIFWVARICAARFRFSGE